MVKVVEPERIPITSISQLSAEFASLQLAFDKDETEHTWEQIDKAVKRFKAVVKGGAHKFVEEFVRMMKSKEIVAGMVRSMATERTRLSASTLELLASTTRLGPSFAPLLPHYLPPLLRLLCRTNKLYISRAGTTLTAIIVHTKLVDILKYVVSEWKAEAGKSTSFRTGATEVVMALVKAVENGDQTDKDGFERRVEELEWILRHGATDREPKVRSEIKVVFEIYKSIWPDRVAAFTEPLTPVTRKYLKIVAGPPQASTSQLSTSHRQAPLQKARPLVTETTSTSHHLPSKRDPGLSKSTSAASTSSKSSIATNALPKSTSVASISSKASSEAASLTRSTSSATGLSKGVPTKPDSSKAHAKAENPLPSASSTSSLASSRTTSRPEGRDLDIASQNEFRGTSRANGPKNHTPFLLSDAPLSQKPPSFKPRPHTATGSGPSSRPGGFRPATNPSRPTTSTVPPAPLPPLPAPTTVVSRSARPVISTAPSGELMKARRVAATAPHPPVPSSRSAFTSSMASSTSTSTTPSASRVLKGSSAAPGPSTKAASAPFRPQPSSLSNKSSTGRVPGASGPSRAQKVVTTINKAAAPTLVKSISSTSMNSLKLSKARPESPVPVPAQKAAELPEEVQVAVQIPLPAEEDLAEIKLLAEDAKVEFELDELVKLNLGEGTGDSLPADDSVMLKDAGDATMEVPGGLLDQMLLMEEEEPNSSMYIEDSFRVNSPKKIGILLLEAPPILEEVEEISEIIEGAMIEQQSAVNVVQNTVQPGLVTVSLDHVKEVLEANDLEEAQDLGLIQQKQGIDEDQISDAGAIEEDDWEIRLVEPEVEVLALPPVFAFSPAASTSRTSIELLPYHIPLPVSPTIVNSAAVVDLTTSYAQLPSSPVQPSYSPVQLRASILPSTPSFHTSHFLDVTPLRADQLPTVRFPKIKISHASRVPLPASPAPSNLSSVPTSPVSDPAPSSSLMSESEIEGDAQILQDTSASEEQGESQSQVESAVEMSFQVPLNDVSDYDSESEEEGSVEGMVDSDAKTVFFRRGDGEAADEQEEEYNSRESTAVFFGNELVIEQANETTAGEDEVEPEEDFLQLLTSPQLEKLPFDDEEEAADEEDNVSALVYTPIKAPSPIFEARTFEKEVKEEEEPIVLKRSLRSREVVVEVAVPTKTPGTGRKPTLRRDREVLGGLRI